ncbi:MAG TPA: hypothetical protein VHC19_27795 [Pirellulales bacterium]|nr:hypothetical protein [Pirellulales bacterium]
MDSSRSLSTRAGNLLLAVVIAAGLAGTAIVGFVGLGSQRSLADAQAAEEGATTTDAATTDDKSAATTSKEDDRATLAEAKEKPTAANEHANDQPGDAQAEPENQLAGIVTGAGGKPVAGAKLFAIRARVHDVDPQPPRLLATTDTDGSYQIVEPVPMPADAPASWAYMDRIVITAPGHGFKYTSFEELRRDKIESQGFVPALAKALLGVRAGGSSLPPTGEPIRGRLVDINGQPVAGAKVRIRWFADEKDQLGGVAEANARGVENPIWQGRVHYLLNVIEPVQLRDVLPSAVTDAEGRFELRDLGPRRLVQLLVEGEGIEATEIVSRNEPGEKIMVDYDRHEPGRELTVYPNKFVYAVGPSKPVTGRVLDLDSGQAIAGAVVRAFQVHGERLSSSREREHFAVRTDAEGRYRITGLPIGKENELVAFATGEAAYIPVGRDADTSKPGRELELDFRLKRGVWAEGRVYDAETRKPFTGEISYYFFRDRELEEAIPGLKRAYVDGLYWTNADGEFRVPVLRTRGILAFRYDGNGMNRDGIDRFARGFGADAIAGSEDLGGARAFPTAPHYLMPTNYERIAEVPATDGPEAVRVDMPLFASPPVTVRVVDADGKPANRFQTYGANERWGWQRLDGPQFEIQDLQPGERRKVFVFQRERNLAGGAFVKYGAKDVVEIKLVKAGSVRGRLLDADGEPIDDATLDVYYEKLHSDDNSAIWAPHPDLSRMPTSVPVDKQGRFRLGGLIPGWSYHARASAPRPYQGQTMSIGIGSVFTDVAVEPGEEKDLGDLTVEAEKPRPKPTEAEKPERPGEPKRASSAQAKVVRGRVTRDGRPAASADVAIIARRTTAKRGGDLGPDGDILAEGKTDASGLYSLKFADASAKTHAYANLIARQPGAAIAWQQLNLDATDSKLDLELPAEEPVRGRLIDLEGQPAADVRLTIRAISRQHESGEMSGVGYHGEEVPAAWFAPIVSDEQGRFVVHAVPSGHGVSMEINQDVRFAPLDIYLSPGANEQRGERDATYRPLVKNLKPGEEAVLTLSPAQPFAGTVTYADSGEPAPHARISIWASQQERFGSMVSVGGRTDENGHYQISPKPGVRFGLIAYPPDGVPYLARQTPSEEPLRWSASEGVKQADMALPRGVLVHGKVVTADSQSPIAGAAVQYIPEESNNPHAADDILTGWQAIQLTDQQGRFSIAVLPGPGRLLAHGPQAKYVLQEIGGRELRQGKRGGERNYAHAILKLDPQPGQDSLEATLELKPGASVAGRIVDELGRAVDEAIVVSRLDVSPYSLEWEGDATPTLGGRFELTGLAKEVEYPVSFLDVKRRLGATEIIKAGEGERTVVLKPCGGATLRAVDKDGKPNAGAYVTVEIVVTPGAYRYDPLAAKFGMLAADSDYIVNIDRTNQAVQPTSDERGYIRLQALIPGASYRIIVTRGGTLRAVKQFQAKSNETLDLGDILVERDQ